MKKAKKRVKSARGTVKKKTASIKRGAKKTPSARKAPKAKRTPNAAFMKPASPAFVFGKASTRLERSNKLWAYIIKKHGLSGESDKKAITERIFEEKEVDRLGDHPVIQLYAKNVTRF